MSTRAYARRRAQRQPAADAELASEHPLIQPAGPALDQTPGAPASPALEGEERLTHDFGQVAVQPAAAPLAPQMQRRISQPGEPHEQEADRVADAVTQTPDGALTNDATPAASHASDTGGGSGADSGGQALDATTRAYMEPRFGYDFSHVRVHTDEQAAQAAADYQARAYTVGGDIVFGAGEYSPETASGRHLLAHELTHVIQQGVAGAAPASDVMRQPAATDESDDTLLGAVESVARFVEELVIEGMELIMGQSAQPSASAGGPAAPAKTAATGQVGAPPQTAASPKGDTAVKTGATKSGAPAQVEAPTEADRAEIAQALASITVSTRTETRPMLHPWEIFQMMPQNTVTKKHLYQAVQRAARKLRDAQAKAAGAVGDAKNAKSLESAQKTFNQAVADLNAYVKKYVLGVDANLRGLRRRESGLTYAIQRLNKQIAKAKNPDALQQELDKRTAELAQVQEDERSRQDELASKIDATPEGAYELQDTAVKFYTITIDGATVSLHDHIDAYATVVANGLEGGATGPGGKHNPSVADALASDAAVSSSRKKILKLIAQFEGEFSTMNTWDRAVLTWGMVQWTGGRKSDLTQALAVIKHAAPDAFAAHFQKYGLDIDEKTDELVITPPTGPQIRGDAAAKAIQDSPELTAVMAAAGTNADIQHGEIQAAVELEINRPLERKITVEVPDTPAADSDAAGGQAKKPTAHKESIKVADIFTSEVGAAIIANQTVHGGFPAGTLHTALTQFVKDNGWRPDDPTWIANAEQTLITHVGALDSDRAAEIKKSFDTAPGTFQ
ncbi:MAG TPA: DUF4157 domain-containing protein [Ktedonobacterales bacterium]|nr:DUF4157 domain-containing protein [Ktedonobacterales bacterium]